MMTTNDAAKSALLLQTLMGAAVGADGYDAQDDEAPAPVVVQDSSEEPTPPTPAEKPPSKPAMGEYAKLLMQHMSGRRDSEASGEDEEEIEFEDENDRLDDDEGAEEQYAPRPRMTPAGRIGYLVENAFKKNIERREAAGLRVCKVRSLLSATAWVVKITLQDGRDPMSDELKPVFMGCVASALDAWYDDAPERAAVWLAWAISNEQLPKDGRESLEFSPGIRERNAALLAEAQKKYERRPAAQHMPLRQPRKRKVERLEAQKAAAPPQEDHHPEDKEAFALRLADYRKRIEEAAANSGLVPESVKLAIVSELHAATISSAQRCEAKALVERKAKHFERMRNAAALRDSLHAGEMRRGEATPKKNEDAPKKKGRDKRNRGE